MTTLDRRSFLAACSTLPSLLVRWPHAPAHDTRDRALIILWMDGGMSHIDTFDGKPEAQADIRGSLRSVESSLEGVFVSEHLPRLRAKMRELALIRTLSSGEGQHDRGTHYMLTGHRPSPILQHPALGALVTLDERSAMPHYVAIPDAHDHARSGFLPRTHGPFELDSDPARPDFRVRDLEARPGHARALDLLARVDALDTPHASADEAVRDRMLERARTLTLDPRARRVFDLREEPDALRARYGRHSIGQSLLLARRLVEAGTRVVFCRSTGWDHHTNIATGLTYGFPPKLQAMDEGLAALHDDLKRRELLDRVLVVTASEFGRTPRINPSGGRDHWPRAHSALLFGAGVRAGTVIGTTDARGEEPFEDPVSPADLHRTLATLLGVDLTQTLTSPDGRPIPKAEVGSRVLDRLLA
ncbi:MAG: DUF1501 domain-containing protein [Planctomycetes bacterium]|nr:DUF1501 domain-containing protein [Planctomycetota bacterium]